MRKLNRADAERQLDADPNPVTDAAGEQGCRILARGISRLPASFHGGRMFSKHQPRSQRNNTPRAFAYGKVA